MLLSLLFAKSTALRTGNTVSLFTLAIKLPISQSACRRQTCPALWQDFPPQATGRHATPLADGRAGGLRESESEAIQAKRTRLSGQRHTVTSLGCLRYRFDAHPPAHSARGSPRRSVIFSCDAFALFRFPCPRSCPPPDTGTPDNCRGLRRCTRQLSPFVSFRPAFPPSA